MKLPNWASQILKQFNPHALKSRLYFLMVKVYHVIPLKPAHKYQLKRFVFKFINKPLSTVQRTILPHTILADNLPADTLKKPCDVFMFSLIDWDFRIQRPQHLAKEFALAGHRVFFFTNHFVEGKEEDFLIEQVDTELALYQIRLVVNCETSIYFEPPSAKVLKQLHQNLGKFLKSSQTQDCLAIVQHAYWYPLARSLPNSTLIYDCMDYHEGFGGVSTSLLETEQALLQQANLVTTTSSWLEQHIKPKNSNVVTIRNACEFSHFSQPPVQKFQDPQGRQIIGYYGAIAEWFDGELVEKVAQAFPEQLILLIGNDTVALQTRLKSYPNVQFTGEVNYSQLPYYLYAFDVCLMPFKVMPLTLATNPVKIYEYLSAGKPVVTVDLPEIQQFNGLVYASDTHQAFIEDIHQVLNKLPESSEMMISRQQFAAQQTWQHRIQELSQAVNSIHWPKISVIVLTYNNLAFTKLCLDSLDRYSCYPNLEIVIVDNASQDESPEFLKAYAANRNDVKLLLNQDNRGFAAGNNQGLSVATGDYLVILNNDTIVTPGWAKGLLNHLRLNPEIGIIGPITNNIGNEAKIDIHYETLAQMQAEARSITLNHMGKCFELDTVAFFCVMFPRAVYEQVGPLCEEYGLGFFEDDDYCRRIQALNLKVACAENVFIHHHLSASFNKLGAQTKQALFDKNKQIYETKWGVWTPHSYSKQKKYIEI